LFRGRIKVMSTIALQSTLNVSKTVRERERERLGFKGLPIKMAYGASNGHVTDDVT